MKLRIPTAGSMFCWAIVISLVLGCCVASSAADPKKTEPVTLYGKVVGVTDGDTLTLLVKKTRYKIRLAGIDAPESGQAFGAKAKQALSSKVFGKTAAGKDYGKTVKVRVTDTDRYGRKVGIIYLDKKCVNTQLVQEGFAWHYVAYSKSKALKDAQVAAQKAKSGLWAEKNPLAPWEYRKQQRARAAAAKQRAKAIQTDPWPAASKKPSTKQPAVAAHWLNTSSNVRHNSSCRYFKNTKRGRACGPNEGKACGTCGG